MILEISEETKHQTIPLPKSSPWTVTFEPFGFGPLEATSRVNINSRTTNTNLGIWDILDVLNGYIPFRASLEYGRLGLITEAFFFNLAASDSIASDGGRPVTGDVGVAFQQGLYDLAVSYRFGARESAVGAPGQYSVVPYAGVRMLSPQIQVSVDLTSLDGRFLSERDTFGRTWIQPLVGTKASVFLSPKLQAFARADIGGFGLAGGQDLSGNAQLGLRYAVGNSTDMSLSWRYLGVLYDNGMPDDQQRRGYNTTLNGIEASLRFIF